MIPTVFAALRAQYHQRICESLLGLRKKETNVLTNADKGSRASVDIARRVAAKLGSPLCENPAVGQAAGAKFTRYTSIFLEEAFKRLQHLRPGSWLFSASQAASGIAIFDQYEHLAQLERVLSQYRELAVTLQGDYFITPDIAIGRIPVTDDEINTNETLVGDGNGVYVSSRTPLRLSNVDMPRPILHASISCKWTMRSDRSQNTRTEALNLIRNRKGNTPHIAAVTFEPLPSRLASIAMGTGDIDCTYHAALYELLDATVEGEHEDQAELLRTLVDGRRLRDISDLPFDLAI